MRLTTALTLGVLLTTAALAQEKPNNSDIENIGSRDINKGSVNFYSLDKEIAMGRQLAAEVERQVRLVEDPTINEYVNRVGQNIVRNSDAKTLPVTFKVVQSADVNAQALLGGFVYITTGTIAYVDNEAELAFVLAQQVAHVAARHATEQASKGGLGNFATIPRIGRDGAQAIGSSVGDQFLQEARAQVMEADFLGVQYLYKAGYDANAATAFLQKTAAPARTPTAQIFSPVPSAAERIAAMQKNTLLILPIRSQNVVTTPEFDRVKALVKQ
jgi:predicted Zn-dependent protease